MTYCIGIDVSKQSLELWDGAHEDEVPNERRLPTLKKLLKKRYGGEWSQYQVERVPREGVGAPSWTRGTA
jgi:hypothetical protein